MHPPRPVRDALTAAIGGAVLRDLAAGQAQTQQPAPSPSPGPTPVAPLRVHTPGESSVVSVTSPAVGAVSAHVGAP